ncbi:MAG: hypothetical protein OQJ97_11810 [Rhodospirillales bacterium]|nr:hypothetical protein [Rhodospirillales bacterium]
MWKSLFFLPVILLTSACGYVSEYEKSVSDFEPTYCYKSLAGVECYEEPYHRDKRRLVNYFGPSPTRSAPPEEDN